MINLVAEQQGIDNRLIIQLTPLQLKLMEIIEEAYRNMPEYHFVLLRDGELAGGTYHIEHLDRDYSGGGH